MDNLELDKTQVLPETTDTRLSMNSITSPIRTIRLLTGRSGRSSKVTNEIAIIKPMEMSNNPSSPVPHVKYGYLEDIQSYKPFCTPDDKSLPKKVRLFYKQQLDFIISLEAILLPKNAEGENEATLYEKRQERITRIMNIAVLITNIVLVIFKIVGSVISKSLSVVSSVVDSIVDLLSGVILIWTARKIKTRDAYKYPTGRTRLEPIAVLILSVIMCSASVEVIFQSGQTLSQDVEYFMDRHNASSSKTLPALDMSTFPIIAMVITIVSKAILFVLCRQMKNPTMSALSVDSRNDVASNIVALVCGLIGSNAFRNKIKQEAIVVDPVGAIMISVYIIISWMKQATRQIRHLTGLTADPLFIQLITHQVYNFRPDVITKIDTVRVVHAGTKYFVEVHIGLLGSTPLAAAHDIGEELQQRLEKLDDVEQAFVHLDFEFKHLPAVEHKVL